MATAAGGTAVAAAAVGRAVGGAATIVLEAGDLGVRHAGPLRRPTTWACGVDGPPHPHRVSYWWGPWEARCMDFAAFLLLFIFFAIVAVLPVLSVIAGTPGPQSLAFNICPLGVSGWTDGLEAWDWGLGLWAGFHSAPFDPGMKGLWPLRFMLDYPNFYLGAADMNEKEASTGHSRLLLGWTGPPVWMGYGFCSSSQSLGLFFYRLAYPGFDICAISFSLLFWSQKRVCGMEVSITVRGGWRLPLKRPLQTGVREPENLEGARLTDLALTTALWIIGFKPVVRAPAGACFPSGSDRRGRTLGTWPPLLIHFLFGPNTLYYIWTPLSNLTSSSRLCVAVCWLVYADVLYYRSLGSQGLPLVPGMAQQIIIGLPQGRMLESREVACCRVGEGSGEGEQEESQDFSAEIFN